MKCGDTFRFRGASMNVLTFDVEDWFHVLDDPSGEDVASWSARESRIDRNVDRVLSLLVDEGVRATFFCLGWIAEQHPRRFDGSMRLVMKWARTPSVIVRSRG
jgi:peptidoglycan/xylan/chitin deacetylase (PgdA/CDA1 family)